MGEQRTDRQKPCALTVINHVVVKGPDQCRLVGCGGKRQTLVYYSGDDPTLCRTHNMLGCEHIVGTCNGRWVKCGKSASRITCQGELGKAVGWHDYKICASCTAQRK